MIVTQPLPILREPTARHPAKLLMVVIAFGLLYGAVMGSYELRNDRLLQVMFSACKVPLLLLCTFSIALPSYFVLNTLLGLRDDFADVLRTMIQAQAVFTIVLASLSPFVIVWYASGVEYPLAIVFNGVLFFISTLASQMALIRLYRPLVTRNENHRRALKFWIVIYSFVGIQIAWTMRPFIGAPELPVRFFREGAWSNAYLEVLHIIGQAMGR